MGLIEMQEEFTKSPVKGHAMRITLDLTQDEVKSEVQARQYRLAQEQARIAGLNSDNNWLAKVAKALGLG